MFPINFQAKQKIRQFAAQHPEHYEAKCEAVAEAAKAAAEAEAEAGLAFEPKVVVRFGLEEPIYDVVMLKKKIKAAVMEPVKYIDARPGENLGVNPVKILFENYTKMMYSKRLKSERSDFGAFRSCPIPKQFGFQTFG